jgi:hypothetical protein
MRTFFARNIGPRGRVVRGVAALVVLGVAYLSHTVWLSGVLTGVGMFMLFEALRGWCVLRACNMKTPL